MQFNSSNHKIINLTDKSKYDSILIGSIENLKSIEVKIKEIALNLLANKECNEWNNSKNNGSIVEINDTIFQNSKDKNVIELYKLSKNVKYLYDKITEDNK